MNKQAAEKLAASIKIAEINGVMGALLETNLVKIASEEDYAVIADAIAERLPEDWDLDTMLQAVDEVMGKYNEIMSAEEGMNVEASDDGMPAEAEVGTEQAAPGPGDVKAEKAVAEAKAEGQIDDPSSKLASLGISESDLYAMYGNLVMQKEAGDISENQFKKEAASLKNIMEGIKGFPQKAWDYTKAHPGNLRDSASDWYNNTGSLKRQLVDQKKRLAATGTAGDAGTVDIRKQLAAQAAGTEEAIKAKRMALLKAMAPELAVGGAAAGGYGLSQLLGGE